MLRFIAQTAFAIGASVSAPVEAMGTDALESSQSVADRNVRSERARAMFEARRFLEAALDFESLWQEAHEPRFLFNAAVSRFALRHQAHTIAYLEEYLRLAGISQEERTAAGVQLAVSQRETPRVTVELQVKASPDGSFPVELERVPDMSSDLRPVVAMRMDGVRGQVVRAVYLDTGRWKVRGRCSDGSVDSVEVSVDQSTVARAVLVLDCSPPGGTRENDDGRRRVAAAATGATGGVAVITGAALMGVFVGQRRVLLSSVTANESEVLEHQRRLNALLNSASVGAGVVGVGVGAVVGGLTTLVGDPVVRRKLRWAQLGVGVAVLAGGVIGRVAFFDKVNALTDHQPVDWNSFRGDPRVPGYLNGRLAMEGLLGLGSGLIAASAIGLIAERVGAGRKRRGYALRAAPVVTPGLRGVSFSWRF